VRIRIGALTVALAAGLIASGCGGGGDGSTDTAPTPPLAQQDYIDHADRICAERDKLVYEKACAPCRRRPAAPDR